MTDRHQTSSHVDRLDLGAPEAEAALLGSMLVAGGENIHVIYDVMQIINGAEDFAAPRHGVLYDVLAQLYARNQSLDGVQVIQELRNRKLLEQVGGADYVISLAEQVPIATNAPHYAKIVRDRAKIRRMSHTGAKLIELAREGVGSAEEIFEQAQQQVIAMLGERERAKITSVASAISDLITDIGEHDENKPIGASTGIAALDELIIGVERGLTYVLGARPSVGKTTFAIQVMIHVALTHGWRVLFFSLETGTMTAGRRFAAQLSAIPLWVLRKKKLDGDDWSHMADAHARMEQADIQIVDCPSASAFDIRSLTVREHARKPVDIIVVDYLQLVSFPDSKSRENEVSAVSRAMKAIGRELNIAVVELAQLNRQGEDRPRVKDLRDSGQIEQDADNIWMLHRADQNMAGEKGAHFTNQTELIVAKQKDGPTGTVNMMFDPSAVRFNNVESDVGIPAALYDGNDDSDLPPV